MLLIGVAGGSGSGKTTFAEKILSRIQNGSVGLLHLDSYYLAEPNPNLMTESGGNFDHPDAFDWPFLKSHLHCLKMGETINVPVYDFKVSRRTSEYTQLGPCQSVLIEGIFTLWEEEIRKLLDLKIYLNVDADIRFIRRLHRDVKERGRSLDGIIRQYYDTVRPMHHEFLEPTRQYADLVVGEETDVAADVVAAKIMQRLV